MEVSQQATDALQEAADQNAQNALDNAANTDCNLNPCELDGDSLVPNVDVSVNPNSGTDNGDIDNNGIDGAVAYEDGESGTNTDTESGGSSSSFHSGSTHGSGSGSSGGTSSSMSHGGSMSGGGTSSGTSMSGSTHSGSSSTPPVISADTADDLMDSMRDRMTGLISSSGVATIPFASSITPFSSAGTIFGSGANTYSTKPNIPNANTSFSPSNTSPRIAVDEDGDGLDSTIDQDDNAINKWHVVDAVNGTSAYSSFSITTYSNAQPNLAHNTFSFVAATANPTPKYIPTHIYVEGVTDYSKADSVVLKSCTEEDGTKYKTSGICIVTTETN